MKYLFPSWKNIETHCGSLLEQINRDKFSPDFIISVLWGGAIPTRIFMDMYDIDRSLCKPIFASCYEDIGKASDKVKIVHMFDQKVFCDKNVLVIDDIQDTGRTIRALRDSFSQQPKSLRVATIYARQKAENKPEYYAQEIEDEWIIFPWEENEFHRYTADMIEQCGERS